MSERAIIIAHISQYHHQRRQCTFCLYSPFLYFLSMQVFAIIVFICICQLTKRLQKVRVKKLGMVDQYLLSSLFNPSLFFSFHCPGFCLRLYFLVFLCLPLPWSEECRRGSESEEISRHTQPLSSYQAHSNPSHLGLCLCLCICICICHSLSVSGQKVKVKKSVAPPDHYPHSRPPSSPPNTKQRGSI